MSFWEAVRTCFRKYADFTGRASRPEYWWFVLSYLVAFSGAVIVDGVVGARGILTLIVFLVYLLPSWAALVRRLHDTGRSGWWYFISWVPLVGIVLLVFLASAGEPGPNRYGPPPGHVPGRPDAGTIPAPPPV